MKTYTFKVVVEPDEGGYHAYCPALRRFGAVTQGTTPAEALKNINEVVHMIVEERGIRPVLVVERSGAQRTDQRDGGQRARSEADQDSPHRASRISRSCLKPSGAVAQ